MQRPLPVPDTFSDMQQSAIERASARFGFSDDEYRDFVTQLECMSFESRELMLCASDPQYFITEYVHIYDPEAGDWIPFELWPAQLDVLALLILYQLVVALKARQLGLTWLALAFALWLMLFRPIAVIMIYSRRDDEAIYLLGDERLRGIYNRLPVWMRAQAVQVDSAHQFKLSNGSVAYAFPTTAGDSYTATFVIMDEADLLDDINKLLRSVKPTVDAGGKLFMLSRSDKTRPQSGFKKIYRGAKAGRNGWKHVFLPWWVRPGRDQAWYERVKADILERTGGLDDLKEQYPSSDIEALEPPSLNKRIPSAWLNACYEERSPLSLDALSAKDIPTVEGLFVYTPPRPGRKYRAGADCAEGLPTSDDSVTVILDAETGEECCTLVGKFTPAVHAGYTARLLTWYNKASILPENNNHGHAFILWLLDNGYKSLILEGQNGKLGWTSNTQGKLRMYDAGAEAAKDGECIIHGADTLDQLKSIEKATLLAPENEMDDIADAFVLALVAIRTQAKNNMPRLMQSSGLYPSRR